MAVWTALNRWLAGATPARAPSAPPPSPAVDSPAPAVPPDLDTDDTDGRFTAWLLGVDTVRTTPLEPAEQAVLDRLEALARAPGDRRLVPRMPALLPRVMALVRRDDMSVRELAADIARDPALLGEVVRVANSPRYRLERGVTDLQDAILLLGQDGLRELLAGVVMGPVFGTRDGRFSRQGAPRLWQQAERCADACANLREDVHGRFEACLAGMVANVGLIVALRVLDRHYASPLPPHTGAFHAALIGANARLSAAIARQWRFPDEVVAALDARARPEPGVDADDLVVALLRADRTSKAELLAP
jgi:HD-like signal output (HDOD) protein